MTTVLQRVANHLTCSRYIIGYIREDPTGGSIGFFDPHTLGHSWSGPRIFGFVTFTLEEIRDFTPTQILHRVREAEAKLLKDLEKSEGKGLGTVGVSLALSLLCVYPVAGFLI